MRWDARKASVHALQSLAVMVLYFVAARIGLAVPFTHGNVSPIWPPAGIALGAILIFGRHVCLGIAAGAFLANFFTPIPHLAALVLGVGNTLGPAVAASLLQGKLVAPIQRLRDVLNLILFGSLGTAISALIGSSTLLLAGVNTGRGLAETFAVWCFGDLMGVFLITPLFLNFADFKLTRLRLAELGLLMASLLVASEFLFRESSIAGAVFGLLLLPFVLWGAARFSIGGATLTCLAASAFAVWATGRGIGPFLPYGTSVLHIHALQMFIAALSLSGLCLAAVIAERTQAEAALAREEKLRRTQEQYRTIIETTNDGVWMIDSDFRTTFVNVRMAELLGYTPEEMLRRTPFDFMFPEDIRGERAGLELRWKGVREVFYTRYRRKDGSELWALVSSTAVSAVAGTFDGALTMQSDVTMLRKSEEALRQSEKLFRGVFEISPLGLALIQPDYRLAKVNASLCRMSGYSEAELIGKNPFDLTHPEDLQQSMSLAQRLFRGEIPYYQIEKRYIKKSGEIIWATMIATILRDRQGRPLLGLGMIEDITDRKRTEAALRQSEERFRSLIEQAPIGITLVNRDYRLLKVNAALCRMLGYSEAELMRMTTLDLSHPEDRQPTINLTERLFKAAIPMHKQEKRYVKKTGEVIWGSVTASLIHDQEDKPLYAMTMIEDITERKRTEAELRALTQRLSLAAQNASLGVWDWDLSSDMGVWDDRMLQIFGIAKRAYVTREDWVPLLHPDDLAKTQAFLSAILRSKTQDTVEFRILRPDGSLRYVSAAGGAAVDKDGKLTGVVGIAMDVTERRQLEQELETARQQATVSARLAALGTMAGGVAHEINNPLAIIHAMASDLAERVATQGSSPPEVVARKSQVICNTAERIAKIVKGLRQISRESTGEPFRPTPLANIVAQTLEICGAEFKANGVELLLPGAIPELDVPCRKAQIAQALLNLLQNAFDAVVGEKGERWVRLEVQPGRESVVISVIDSGPGIPSEIRSRVMEPFFTTKPVGKGVGLGLSLSRAIAEDHGGSLEYSEEKGHTRLSLVLPLATTAKAA